MVNSCAIDGGICSKRASAWFGLLVVSSAVELSDVYGSYSDAKRRGYERARRLFDNCPCATRFRIIAHNCNTFTVAWLFEDAIDEEGTGELHRFMAVKTAYNLYYFLIA